MVTHELTKTLLFLQMINILFFLFPFPKKWKKVYLNLFFNSRYAEHIFYFFRIVFIFNSILFVDSGIRIVKTPLKNGIDLETSISYFYSQRNVYLTGFVLFLFIILSRLTRLFTIIYKEDEKSSVVKKQAEKQGEEYIKILGTEKEKVLKIASLEKIISDMEIKCKDADAKINQAKNQQQEYLRLSEKYYKLKEESDKDKKETKKDK